MWRTVFRAFAPGAERLSIGFRSRSRVWVLARPRHQLQRAVYVFALGSHVTAKVKFIEYLALAI